MSTLRIRRFRSQYLIASEYPEPVALQERLDTVAAREIERVLREMTGPALPETDESVWFLRSLDIEIAVADDWDSGQIAHTWAQAIAQAILTELQAGEDKAQAVRFENRAGYVGAYVRDTATGTAQNHWYYRDFEGLRLLPASAAIRTALSDNSETGVRALASLDLAGLISVLTYLTAPDARRLLDRFFGPIKFEADVPARAEALWAVWERLKASSMHRAAEQSAALALCVFAVQNAPSPIAEEWPGLGEIALALVRLERLLSELSPPKAAHIRAALTSGDLAALYATVGTENAEALSPLRHCPPEWLNPICRQMSGDEQTPNTASAAEATERDTPFGGLFLLLPLLAEMPLDAMTEGWPDLEDDTAAAAVRLLLLSRCCGRTRVRRVQEDSLIRDLAGISPGLRSDTLSEWQAQIQPEHVQQFQQRLVEWHRERGVLQGQTQILARIPCRGSKRFAVIALECERGYWLGAVPSDGRRIAQTVASMQELWQETGTIVCDPRFTIALRLRLPEIAVVALGDDALGPLAENEEGVGEMLARLERQGDDLEYLEAPGEPPNPGLDLALRLASQNLLRAFSGRLPGFARSGSAYLYANFLEMPATLQEEPHRRIVRLGRPPLHLVLSMTGMTRTVTYLPWLDDVPFALYPEG